MTENISVAEQSVLPNNNVLFPITVRRSRCFNCCNGFNHTDGSGLFQVSKAGDYLVLFNANITSATAGAVQFAIKVNGEIVQGSQMIFTATANGTQNVSTSTIITVCGNGSKTISVGNVGSNVVTVSNPNIIIKKVN